MSEGYYFSPSGLNRELQFHTGTSIQNISVRKDTGFHLGAKRIIIYRKELLLRKKKRNGGI